MRTFKDANGDSWNIAVTVGSAKRVKDLARVDLLDLKKGELLMRLGGDPETLFDVVFAIVKPQADERKITDFQFAELLDGNAVETATDALMEELVDFFPKAKRPPLRKAMKKVREVEKRQVAAAMAKLDDPELEKTISAAIVSGT